VGGLLESGFELMMIGMGTVFSFLALLVVVTQSMSWVVLKFGLASDPHVANLRLGAADKLPSTSKQSAQHVAAIAVALDTHLRTPPL
jgi:sodium pump decarboxylase gamma subunit|tara:strand:+ start:1078 stop:1338 length:261 start_codon:yes stop_codon:yes gene_type:complete